MRSATHFDKLKIKIFVTREVSLEVSNKYFFAASWVSTKNLYISSCCDNRYKNHSNYYIACNKYHMESFIQYGIYEFWCL